MITLGNTFQREAAEKARLAEQVSALQKALFAERNKYEESAAERFQLQEQIEQMRQTHALEMEKLQTSQRRQLVDSNQTLSDELARERTELSVLRAELANAREALERTTLKLGETTAQLRAVQSELGRVRHESESMRRVNDVLGQAKGQKEAQCAALISQKHSLQRTLADLRIRLSHAAVPRVQRKSEEFAASASSEADGAAEADTGDENVSSNTPRDSVSSKTTTLKRKSEPPVASASASAVESEPTARRPTTTRSASSVVSTSAVGRMRAQLTQQSDVIGELQRQCKTLQAEKRDLINRYRNAMQRQASGVSVIRVSSE